MRTASSRSAGAVLAVALLAALAGCGKTARVTLRSGAAAGSIAAVAPQGAVSVATGNTTRLGGADAASDAAAVARAVYPGLTATTRPQAVVLVDERDWPAALAAASLSGAPLRAPVLYSAGASMAPVTEQTLAAMRPAGARALAGAQLIRVGATAAPGGLTSRAVPAGAPASTAAALARLLIAADGGKPPRQVIVVPSDAPAAIAAPAAGLAAESGAPILFVTAASVPAATASVLAGLHRPSMYVVDAAAVGHRTLAELAHLGSVTPIAGSGGAGTREAAVANAIAIARFTDGGFGWGVKEPGHGLVFADYARPLDAPAAALLSATGDYAPLLLLESPAQVPPALAAYLGDIQPAYTSAPEFRPVRGVYNHGWLIGDESAISAVSQAEIDSVLEISPRKPSSEEPSVSPVE